MEYQKKENLFLQYCDLYEEIETNNFDNDDKIRLYQSIAIDLWVLKDKFNKLYTNLETYQKNTNEIHK
jgi:hypothetical protein